MQRVTSSSPYIRKTAEDIITQCQHYYKYSRRAIQAIFLEHTDNISFVLNFAKYPSLYAESDFLQLIYQKNHREYWSHSTYTTLNAPGGLIHIIFFECNNIVVLNCWAAHFWFSDCLHTASLPFQWSWAIINILKLLFFSDHLGEIGPLIVKVL